MVNLKILQYVILASSLVRYVHCQTCSQKYTVVSGDTCNGIGTKFGVTGSAIISANPTINSGCTNFQIGQVLCIPSGSCPQKYTVVSGDTCNGIGTKFGVTGSAIISANPTINSGCTNLQIGQVLCIPSATGGGNPIPNWASCTKGVSTCANNWSCCVAPADCATQKTTCRPGGTECSSCSGGGNPIPNWASCTKGVSTCADNWSCCVAPADCATQKTTCRPGGTECSSCTPSSNIIGWFNEPYTNGVSWPVPYGTPNANMAATFYGYNDLARNIQFSPKIDSRFPGTKFITIGGGDSTGRWSVSVINTLINDINQKKVPSEYKGIGIDIEEGDSGLLSSFRSLFSTAKANSLQVFVTVSGNAPYGISDKCDLMKNGILLDSNINFLVPQLYSTTDAFEGGANECGWSMWKTTKIPIVPVIWRKKYKDSGDLDNWAKANGLSLSGYMVWFPN